MFVNGMINNYSTNRENTDSVPEKYYHLKNKIFGDWEIPPWELFIFEDRLLGEGGFSKVYLAKWRETFVVAKVLRPEIVKDSKNLILREIDIMSKLHHPNIVQFLGYIDDPFIIIMEYIPNKNLQNNYNLLTKSLKMSITKDILRGLAYVHNRKPYSVIHRDIKPTNIILTNSKLAKLTDFGLSKFYGITKTLSNTSLNKLDSGLNVLYENDLTNGVGTYRYMAPEMKKCLNYTNKVDIFSCGALLYELFENKRFVDKNILRWYKSPKKIKHIILNHMLQDNPDDRLDALSILKLLD